MDLGTTISRLRTERNMSQGDLAEALDVSRQSVSKWETNASVPELDKLVKLSRLFGVSLDELVTGEAPLGQAPPTSTPLTKKVSHRRIAGFIFLGIAVMVWLSHMYNLLFDLACTLPFLLCSALCFLCVKPTSLACFWVLCFGGELYIRTHTTVLWRVLLRAFSFTPRENYMILAIAIVRLFVFILMIGCTLYSFRRTRFDLSSRKNRGLFLGGWVLLAALYAVERILEPIYWDTPVRARYLYAFRLLVMLCQTSCLFLLLALLILTVCALRGLRNKPE